MHVSDDLLPPPSGLSMRMTSDPGLRFAGPGLTSRRRSAARLVIFSQLLRERERTGGGIRMKNCQATRLLARAALNVGASMVAHLAHE
jgi:hypothetical protein